MLRLSTLPIRSLLLLIILLVVLPTAGIVLYSEVHFRNLMFNDARNETVNLCDRIASEQQSLVVCTEQLMTALAQLPEVKEHDASKVTRILRDLQKLNPMYSNIFIADLDGRVWAESTHDPLLCRVSDRRYFKNALTTGRLATGECVTNCVSRGAFNLAYPVKDGAGRVAGVISVGFTLDQYRQLLNRMGLSGGTSFVIMDHNGIILARGIKPEKYIGKPYPAAEFQKMKAGPETGTSYRKGLAGDDRIISYRKLHLAGEQSPYLYVTAGIPVEVATREANKALVNSIILFSLLIMAGCSLAMLIGKRCIGDRIRLLEDASKRLAGGDMQVKVSDLVRGGELGSLGQTFDEMAEKLRLRESALARSERFLNTIIETEPECVKMLDAEGKLQMMNRAGLAMLDVDSMEQVQGQCVYPLITPEYRDAFKKMTDDVFQGFTRNLVFEAVGVKGRRVWLDSHSVPFRNEAGEIISLLSITRDITDHLQAEEERLQTLQLFESLMKYSPVGIRIFDGESGRCLLLNDATACIAGGSVEEMRNQNFRELQSWHECGLLESAEAVLEDGSARVIEADINTSFGRKLKMSYIMSRLIIKEKRHLLVIGRDVTDEKRMAEENKKIEAQMLHVQKLESLGVLAGGIAHDFNNILMAILGNAELALMRLSADSPAVGNLNQIEISAKRAADLAQQMLAYSGKGRFVIQRIDLNALIKEMSHMLQVSISKKVAMRFALADKLPLLEADATQMRQVIMNLVINASEAIGDENGIIAISTGSMECDSAFLSDLWLNDSLQGGTYVYVEVTDSGCGMDRETVARIFDPFFTTKFTGRGLGMAAVLGIIRGHKGAIKVYSEPGRGSNFKIFLPACPEGSVAALHQETPSMQLAMGSGCVLLVDDEDTILSLGREMLETLGYDVLLAKDGVEALEVFRARQSDISCIILDLTMPRMDGEQTFRALQEMAPDVQVVMSSGFSEQEITRKFVGRGLAGFIQKPYKIAELSRKLQLVNSEVTSSPTARSDEGPAS